MASVGCVDEIEDLLCSIEDARAESSYLLRIVLLGVGVNRYYVSETAFLDIAKDGINYKDSDVYRGPRLLVRRTGIGIYATIDRGDTKPSHLLLIINPATDFGQQAGGSESVKVKHASSESR
jgi:hypothetical protein